MFIEILLLVVALLVVVKAADWFLRAAETIGVRLGLSSFVLGVLVVGFGTSLPELSTSIASVIDNNNNVAIANIIGSNLANVLVILGLSTFILGTIRFQKDLIDLDLPLLFAVTVLFSILVSDGNLTMTDGILLLVGFVGYVVYTLGYKEEPEYHRGLISLVGALSRSTRRQVVEPKVKPTQNAGVSILLLVGSLALLAVASKVAVDSLLDIVREVDYGVEQLTFFTLAIGTSLPELVVSFKALRKGQGDVVLGNVLGSSIFNILMVGGIASVVHDQFINTELVFWSLTGLLVTSLMLVVSGITRRIHAWEGMMFLLVYGAIVSRLI